LPPANEDEPEPLPNFDDQYPPKQTGDGAGSSEDRKERRSLLEDLEYLIADARIWLDAEMSFQKSRAALVANRIKIIVVASIVAALLGVLALVGLTVGLIIALTPLITAWGATAVVVGLLLLIAWLMVKRAAMAWGEIEAVTRRPSAPVDAED